MFATNIINRQTGQAGYQVPGAALVPGWEWSNGASSTPAPAPAPAPTTPTPTPTPTTGTPTPYYSRVNQNTNTNTANANLAPTVARSESEIYNSELAQRQKEIDAINAKFDAFIGTQNNVNKEQDAEANAIARASGQAGSPDAYTGIRKSSDLGADAINKIQAERSAEIQSLLGNISQTARETAKTEAETARTTAKNYLEDQSAKALKAIKGLAYKGIDPATVKESNPDEYQYLLNMYNGDENAMNADYVANIPAESIIGSPITSGSTVTYLSKDPLTGKVKTTSIETGVNLTEDKDTTVHSIAGVGLALVNKRDGTAKIIGGTKPVTKSTTGTDKKLVSGGLEYTPADIADATNKLTKGKDGYTDPYLYQDLYKQWTSTGGLTKDFVAEFPPAEYVNPESNGMFPKYLQNNKY